MVKIFSLSYNLDYCLPVADASFGVVSVAVVADVVVAACPAAASIIHSFTATPSRIAQMIFDFHTENNSYNAVSFHYYSISLYFKGQICNYAKVKINGSFINYALV